MPPSLSQLVIQINIWKVVAANNQSINSVYLMIPSGYGKKEKECGRPNTNNVPRAV